MCTQARSPSPSRRMLSASSKSFASSGSIVNASRSRRSTRSGSSPRLGGVAAPARAGAARPRARAAPRARPRRRPGGRARARRAPGRARARTRRGRRRTRRRALRSTTTGAPGSKNGSPTRSFPRRASSPTSGSTGYVAQLSRRARPLARRAAPRRRRVSGSSVARTFGPDSVPARSRSGRASGTSRSSASERVPFESGRIDCTVALPYVRSPTTTARSLSRERGRDDLGRARAPAVDEDDERRVLGKSAPPVTS